MSHRNEQINGGNLGNIWFRLGGFLWAKQEMVSIQRTVSTPPSTHSTVLGQMVWFERMFDAFHSLFFIPLRETSPDCTGTHRVQGCRQVSSTINIASKTRSPVPLLPESSMLEQDTGFPGPQSNGYPQESVKRGRVHPRARPDPPLDKPASTTEPKHPAPQSQSLSRFCWGGVRAGIWV